MAIAVWPAYAKIRQLDLAIQAPTFELRSQADMRAPYGSPLREIWQGRITIPPLSRANLHAFMAWCHSLDGRVSPFRVTLKAGVFTRTASNQSGTLNSTPALGADTIALAGFSNPTTLARGTLLGVGDYDTDDYQMVEVIEDATFSADGDTVRIAPRIRVPVTGGATVVVGDVQAKLRLAVDDLSGMLSNASYGTVDLPVVEGL